MRVEPRLRAFAALARHGSFTRAADELLISQPAVSKHVSSLERELKTKLVARDHHHVAMTPAGEVLADYVLRAEALLANGRRHVGSVAGGTAGTLAANETATETNAEVTGAVGSATAGTLPAAETASETIGDVTGPTTGTAGTLASEMTRISEGPAIMSMPTVPKTLRLAACT